MGWKNIKQHYSILHIVHVRDDKILIGSPYVSDLLSIDQDCNVIRPHTHLGEGGDLTRIRRAMEGDRKKLRELMVTPDTFGELMTVYTFEDDRIIEKQCEEIGFPNVTTDGELMYDNSHFAKREQAIRHAKRNAAAIVSSISENVERREAELASMKADLANWRGIAERLEAAS